MKPDPDDPCYHPRPQTAASPPPKRPKTTIKTEQPQPNLTTRTEAQPEICTILSNSAIPSFMVLEEKQERETLETNSSSPSLPKLRVEKEESERDVCGICLWEEGKASRGWIDSCGHYFCFVCILEWSKVESKCPLCKARFSTIKRLPKAGLFGTERVVNVPERNQVHHYFGNVTTGPSNPYSDVKCSVCQGEADENLIILCDLCDSGAHTYCVGLGNTVPEDDWFCQDCTLLRDERARNEMDSSNDSQTEIRFENSNNMHSGESIVSVLDMVRETGTDPERPSTVNTYGELSARTLRRCRNVHTRIMVLRENWNGFRNGSVRFPSKTGDKSNTGQQQSTAQNDPSHENVPSRGLYDVDKAWKMMNAAKRSMGRSCGRGANAMKEAGKMKSKLLISDKRCGSNNSRARYYSHSCSHKNSDDKHNFQIFMKEKQLGIVVKRHDRFFEGFSTGLLENQDPSSSKKFQMSIEVDKNQGKDGNLSQENIDEPLFHGFKESCGSCFSNPALSLPLKAPARSPVKEELHASSSCNPKEKGDTNKVVSDDKGRKADDLKSEILSHVKINLMLLSKDKKLEAHAFKEVARHATHSIMAACGLERRKAGIRSFPVSVCCHIDKVPHVRRSTLMPSSCRECYFAFVKDVVNTITFERLDHSRV